MIGNTIKELREQRGWSHQALATKLHLNKKTVADWETGNISPSAKSIVGIVKLFGITADRLLGLGDDTIICLDMVPQKDRKKIEAILRAMLQTCIDSSLEEAEQES